MKTAMRTKGKTPHESRRLKTATLFAEEVFWLNIAAKLTGGTAAKFISPLIRDKLRKVLTDHGVDPDKVWAEYEAASRN